MRSQLLKDVLISEQGNERRIVRCEVCYYKGMGGRPRGYYLDVSPMALEQCDGYSLQKYLLFSGKAWLLLEAKRYSEKSMRNAVLIGEQKLLDPVVAGFIEECVRVPVEV